MVAERVGHEVGELHVDHLVGREHARVGGPPCRGRGRRRCRARTARRRPRQRRRVAGHLAQVGGEGAHRRDDLERVAVGLDDDGVGVLGQQAPRCQRWAGDLSSHRSPMCPDCRCCEVAAVPAVGGREVGLVEQPAVVGGHLVLDGEDHRAEVAAGDPHALLGEPRADRVEGAEAGDDEVGHRRGRPRTSSMRGSVS